MVVLYLTYNLDKINFHKKHIYVHAFRVRSLEFFFSFFLRKNREKSESKVLDINEI